MKPFIHVNIVHLVRNIKAQTTALNRALTEQIFKKYLISLGFVAILATSSEQ